MRTLLMASVAAAMLIQPAAADFKLGWAGPLTGGSAALGQQALNGVRQAVSDINLSGGILGEKVDLQVEDDAGDLKIGRVGRQHHHRRWYKFLIGHQNSGASIPASSVYAEAGTLEVTPSSTNPVYTDRGLWNTFRTCGRDDQQGTVAGAYLAKTFAGKKVFIVNDKTTYGKGLADEVKKTMNRNNLVEIADDGINAGEKDYSALVSQIKLSGADVVYFGGLYTEGGLIRRQMTAQGVGIPLIGGDGLFSSEFASIAGPGGDGAMITFSPDPRRSPAAAQVISKMEADKVSPEGYTLYGYAAVQIIAEGIRMAGKPDPRSVAEKLHSGITVETVLGPMNYDSKGDIRRLDFVFYKQVDGRFQEMTAQQ